MDFEEFVTLLGPKISAAGMPDKFNGTDFDSVFWKVINKRLCLIKTDMKHSRFWLSIHPDMLCSSSSRIKRRLLFLFMNGF